MAYGIEVVLSQSACHITGLKKDLRAEALRQSDIENANNFVSFDEGKKMAEQIGAADFLECSSLKGEGVDDVFESAIRATLKSRKKLKYRLRKYVCFL